MMGYRTAALNAWDYYAAHAPEEIPDWFKGPAIPSPKRPDFPALIEGLARDWWNDPCWNLHDAEDLTEEQQAVAKGFEAAAYAYWVAAKKAEKDRVEGRFFAWRFYYADMMMAESANRKA